jgi:hypothetical protein
LDTNTQMNDFVGVHTPMEPEQKVWICVRVVTFWPGLARKPRLWPAEILGQAKAATHGLALALAWPGLAWPRPRLLVHKVDLESAGAGGIGSRCYRYPSIHEASLLSENFRYGESLSP